MSDMLSQLFDKFLGGGCTPEVFEYELLAVCSSSPERAWQALALLDRYYRQHKLSDGLCRALRQRIGARAMRLEGHSVETPLHQPDPDSLFAATMTAPAPGSGAYRTAAMAQIGRVTAARAAASAAPLATGIAAAAAPMAAAPKPPAPVAFPTQAAPLPPPVSLPAMDHQAAQADASLRASPLPDDDVEALLTTPTVPVARQDDAKPGRWRRGFQTSPALGLIAVVLGVAASTQVRDPPERLEPITPDVTTIAPLASVSDHDPAVVSLSSDRYLVQPNQRTVEFTVERSSGSGAASFEWWTQPSSARSSEDYVGARARVVDMPDGTKSMTLQVPILENPQRRHIDMFYVVIGNADGGAELGAIRRAAVFIFPSGRS